MCEPRILFCGRSLASHCHFFSVCPCPGHWAAARHLLALLFSHPRSSGSCVRRTSPMMCFLSPFFIPGAAGCCGPPSQPRGQTFPQGAHCFPREHRARGQGLGLGCPCAWASRPPELGDRVCTQAVHTSVITDTRVRPSVSTRPCRCIQADVSSAEPLPTGARAPCALPPPTSLSAELLLLDCEPRPRALFQSMGTHWP